MSVCVCVCLCVCVCVCVIGVCSLLYNNQPLENTIESGEVIWSKKCR